jgi:hypothetical protein
MPTDSAQLPALTLEALCKEATNFAAIESQHWERTIHGVTDGKAIGTYVEAKFQEYLRARYSFRLGSAAKGIDFPELNVDLKVTSVKQPQSSCPFRSARQKVYGLGYALLVLVYEKVDDAKTATGRLNFLHTIYVEPRRTADFQTTRGLLALLANDANVDDILAFIEERRLPVEEIGARAIAEEVLKTPPEQGYLTISNAQQWRLQYGRVVAEAGQVDGIQRLR